MKTVFFLDCVFHSIIFRMITFILLVEEVVEIHKGVFNQFKAFISVGVPIC